MVADMFAVTLVLLAHIVAFAVSIFSNVGIIAARIKFGYFPIFHLMIMGLSGAFLTGDIFNLYVWFEVIIISSFVLLTIGGKKNQIEGAVKYFTLNMLASIVFLTAIGMLYGATGTLNMAELATIIPEIENKGLIEIIALCFLIAFGVKAGIFPLYFWLPAAYHTPPSAVSALFGGLLTKLGVYAMIRIFTLVFPMDAFNFTIIEIIAFLTILSGALGAFVQKDIIKSFAYLIICHIGFMIAGLGMGLHIALVGAIFYMIHDIIVKANLFFISGITSRIAGSSKLENMGGVLNDYPKLAVLFFIPLFSLVGIPPLSGFWPKISLFSGAFESGNYWLLGALIFGSFMTLVIVARIWLKVFSKKLVKRPRMKDYRYFDTFNKKEKISLILPIAFLALVSLFIGFSAESIQLLVERIVEELTNKDTYINLILKNLNTTAL
jgi:multicomponent Na+:H+ antiporter subunit D